MRSTWFVVWMAASFIPAGCSSSKSNEGGGSVPMKDDKELIQGTWQVTDGEKNGGKRSTESIKDRTLVITADSMTFMDAKQKGGSVTYTLRGETTPKEVDLVPVQGGDKGRTLPGVYELNGDVLKVCWNDMGGDRPKGFDTKGPPSGLEMMVLKRVK